MKQILVPCDFSKPAVNALRIALDVADLSKATIHVLTVRELPMIHNALLIPNLTFDESLLNEMREKAESDFKILLEKYNTANTKVLFKVEFGPFLKIAVDYIKHEAIDLALMGSHGTSGFREFFIGSTAEKMLRNSPVPVLVVKRYTKAPIKNTVFPNGLELENQEDLVSKVKELQEFFDAKLHLLWVNTPLNFISDIVTHRRLIAFGQKHLIKNYTINVFNHPDPEEGILAFNRIVQGDLIAIETHGRKGIDHLLNSSLAENLVNHTNNLIWTYALKHEDIENHAHNMSKNNQRVYKSPSSANE